MFRFLPHTLTGEDAPEGFRVLDFERVDHPDAWDPLDELSVTFHSPSGRLLGIMYVDRPSDGLRPSSETIEMMELFVLQAGFAISHAQHRERLSEQVWLSGMVRSVIETTAAPARRSHDLERVLDSALSTLRVELSAVAASLQMFAADDQDDDDAQSRGAAGVFTVSAALETHGEILARDCLRSGEALVLDRGDLTNGHRLFTPAQRTWLLRAFEIDRVHSLVLAPLSLDADVAGQLVLMRSHDQPWTDAERAAVRDIGRELGWAIGRDRSRRRETAAAEALERLSHEQRELIGSLCEEVSMPLAAVDAYLTGSGLPADHPARVGMDAFWGTYQQVTTMIDFERPDRVPTPQEADVPTLLQVQWAHAQAMAEDRGIRLLPLDAAPRQHAWADPEQLEWLMQVLLEDVVRTATTGSSVRISVNTLNDRLLVSCQISGIDDPDEPMTEPADENQPRWWRTGANLLLAKQGGRLTSRSGPLGRRVLSMSLPMPPETAGSR